MSTKTPERFRVGLVQMACGDGADDNLARAIARVHEAADKGAQVVCLQELFRSRYFCTREDPSRFALAEPVPGPSTELLAKAAREREVVIVASLFERRAPGLYHNTAAVLDADGALVGLYRKMHIPDDPLYYEKYYFAPGDTGFRAFDTRYGCIGVLVCWDQWYPEGARLTALQGASVLFYPTAIGWHPSEKAEFGSAAERLADDPARPRDRQWGLCRGGQSRRARAARRRRHRVLGRQLPERSVRAHAGRGRARRRDVDRRVRPAPPRGGAAQLALPARSPHRRLCGHRQALHRSLIGLIDR